MTTFTQSHLDNLREMATSGVTEASYDGKTIKYRTMAELLQAIAMVERALGQGAPRQHYPTLSRGL